MLEEMTILLIFYHVNAFKINVIQPHVNNITDQYVNFIIKHSTPSSLSINEIRNESLKDEILKSIIAAIETGNWNNSIVKEYECMKLELCESNGIVLRENRIVLPYALHEKAITIVHQGHLGMEKSKQLLRSKVAILERNG